MRAYVQHLQYKGENKMAGALLKYNGQALQTPSGAYGINNLVPENVKSGVNIGGVVGNYSGEAIIGTKYFMGNTHVWVIPNVPHNPKTIILYRRTFNSYYEYANYVIRETENGNIRVLSGASSGQTTYLNSATISYDETTKALRIELLSNGYSTPNFRDNWDYILI